MDTNWTDLTGDPSTSIIEGDEDIDIRKKKKGSE